MTTVIGQLGWNKRPLMLWAWREGLEGRDFRDSSQSAADAGTIAHAMIEEDIHGREWQATDEPEKLVALASKAFKAWESWRRSTALEIVATEMELVSEAHRYGGCPDAVGRIDGELCLLDWKTSNGVYADYLLQGAAYIELWNETQEEQITGGFHLLRVGKQYADFHHHYWPDLGPAWDVFQRLRATWDDKKTLEGMAR